ncbi:hypothetical protein L6164_005599 [Bauhinia variegata]|uniref:Uncharacterized protein n=1 Tax=Bauhinia variegata TaxID=167791 RepID=A0ACB9PRT5_BAUVA|nr:hypothetical protein L6164_005599 [Bauhinia variegata]
MNNNTTTNSTNHHHVASGSGFTYGIIFTIGMVVSILTFLLACVRLRVHLIILHVLNGLQPRRTAAVQDSVEVTNRQQGLDETIIHSYPKLLYSQIKKRDSVSSCCSICLADFTEVDELRMLPDCGHLYHLSCIDSWLKLHATCPICRNSPVRASRTSMPAAEVTIHIV